MRSIMPAPMPKPILYLTSLKTNEYLQLGSMCYKINPYSL